MNFENVMERIDLPAPPRGLANVYDTKPDHESWMAVGVCNAENLVRLGGLKRGEALLDVGCGAGRLAMALSPEFAGAGSRYEGVDPHQEGVNWAQQNITPRYPDFRFRHIDVFNAAYNKVGAGEERVATLPYDDNAFDIVALFSVFTHITTAGVLRYLDEIHRVLKPGGRMFATFFLIDDHAKSAIANKTVRHQELHAFEPGDDAYWTSKPDLPEVALAYPVEFIRNELLKRDYAEPAVHFGQWCRRKTDMRNPYSQDVLISAKP